MVIGLFSSAQVWDGSTHQPPDNYKNVSVSKVHSDSSQSAFIIWVKEEVKSHFHANHTEFIYILAGEAEMRLGDSLLVVKAGDFFIIPPGTVHSVKVTGDIPLKVISIQTPEFKGNDRIWVDE